MMQLNLDAQLEAYIKQQASMGGFESIEAYLENMIEKDRGYKRLSAINEQKRQNLIEAIEETDRQFERGEYTVFDKHFMNDISKRVDDHIKNGTKPPYDKLTLPSGEHPDDL